MRYIKTFENQNVVTSEESTNLYWYYKSEKVECIFRFLSDFKWGTQHHKVLVLYINTTPFKIKTKYVNFEIASKIRPATVEEIKKFDEEVEYYSTVNKYNL